MDVRQAARDEAARRLYLEETPGSPPLLAALSAPVEQIVLEGGRATGVRVGGETLPADVVISTVTTSRFRQLARGLDGEYVRRLERIPTIGIFCLFLRLREPVTLAPLAESVHPLVLTLDRKGYGGPFAFTVRIEDADHTYQLSRTVEFMGPDAKLLEEEDRENGIKR